MNLLAGYKTYIAAAGLLCLGLYQMSVGDVAQAIQNIFAALATFGVRSAIARQAK
jgi:hypothetical protein